MSTVAPRPSSTAVAASLGAFMRPMEERDLERVGAIEIESFSTPWHAATFRTLLGRSGAVLRVLEAAGDPVAGYAVLWCIGDQAELANIAVSDELRDRGLGAFLLDGVLEEARARGVESIFLEVRTSNQRARAMYASRGFEEIGRRRDYYDKPREDAHVLMKHLDPIR